MPPGSHPGLAAAHPGDWAAFPASRAGVPPGPVTSLDTDLSATLQADRLFRIDGEPPAILHLELESAGRRGIPAELLRYNAFAHYLHAVPVYTVLVLLRPKATAADLTGGYVVGGPGGEVVRFRYTVVRVWREAVADLLAAGPGLAPPGPAHQRGVGRPAGGVRGLPRAVGGGRAGG